jgi:HEAT repeat protein
MNAVVALGWLEMAALPAAPDIAAALSDESQPVRFSAAQLLKTLGPSAHETLPVLLFALQSTNASIADNVIGVVVSVGQDQPETVRSLVGLLAGPDEVKVRVLETLSRLGKPARAAEPGINSLLASTNSNVKAGAACALWEIVPARHVELFREIEGIAKSNDKKLHLLAGLKLIQMQPLTPQAGELLAMLIREGNDSFGWSAFAALRKRGADASNAVPALIAGLEAENPRVVAKAAEALGDVAGPEQSTLRSLEKAQQHEHLMVRDAAREALTKLQSRVER